MPSWIVSLLADQWVRIQSSEQLRAISAALTPNMKDDGRNRYISSLENLASAVQEQENPPPKFLEYDPEKAKAWFVRRGIKVVDGG